MLWISRSTSFQTDKDTGKPLFSNLAYGSEVRSATIRAVELTPRLCFLPEAFRQPYWRD